MTQKISSLPDYITAVPGDVIDMTSLCIICEQTQVLQGFYSSGQLAICKECKNDLREIIRLKRALK